VGCTRSKSVPVVEGGWHWTHSNRRPVVVVVVVVSGDVGLRQGSSKNAERSGVALCQRGVGMCKQANEWRGETRGSSKTLRRRVGEAVTRLLGR
jgi:hypothetical protein